MSEANALGDSKTEENVSDLKITTPDDKNNLEENKEKENSSQNDTAINIAPEVADASLQENLSSSGDLERLQNENTNLAIKIQNLERDLQVRTEERENYKNKVQMLETELSEAKPSQPNTLSPAQQNAVEKMKKQSEEILTRAKGVIFDKTKLIKHQELQIETLTLQIASLKEVLGITKELLEIRNLEVKELQDKMDFMEQRIATEKTRHDLMNAKMEAMTKMNADLKTEYETQLHLFEELRSTYTRKDELSQQQGKSS